MLVFMRVRPLSLYKWCVCYPQRSIGVSSLWSNDVDKIIENVAIATYIYDCHQLCQEATKLNGYILTEIVVYKILFPSSSWRSFESV